MEQAVIEIQSINKSYQLGNESLKVLNDISLTVRRGEFLAILGPSGSGKSTLMNVIGCMDRFDSGAYYLNGEAVHQMKEAGLTRIRNREIGFVFQRYQLIPRYSILQNAAMPLLLRGLGHDEAFLFAARQLISVGLGERMFHKPNELSGGQQQRAAIARALAGAPSVLLADEPTGALDTRTGLEVLELFRRVNRGGNTIVMITHNEEVARFADRCVQIVDGRLYEGGSGKRNLLPSPFPVERRPNPSWISRAPGFLNWQTYFQPAALPRRPGQLRFRL